MVEQSTAKQGGCSPGGDSPGAEQRAGLSHQEFIHSYLYPRKPVVLCGALDQWPAVRKWTPDYFRTRVGTKSVVVDGQNYTMDRLIELILHSKPSQPAPYIRAQKLRELFPELLSDLEPAPVYGKPNWAQTPALLPKRIQRMVWTEILLGGAGASFHVLHYDTRHLHAFIAQLYGTKEVFLYAPDQTPYMYPRPDTPNQSLIPDIHRVDETRFPLFKKAKQVSILLEPGNLAFIPAGWWHTTRMPGPSIGATWNLVNGSNWADFTCDIRDRMNSKLPLLGTIWAQYARALGWWQAKRHAQVWKALAR